MALTIHARTPPSRVELVGLDDEGRISFVNRSAERLLGWDEEHKQVSEEQLSLVLGDNYVYTFQEREGDVFESVRERIRQGRGRIRSGGADYLAYALMDAVVDRYFPVLNALEDELDLVEEKIFSSSMFPLLYCTK